MERVKLNDNLEFSRIVQGIWRLAEWKMTSKEILELVEKCMDIGITTFDHADIYGDYTCESLFGNAIALKPEVREKMQIVTKCGIKLISQNRPEHKIKYYDTSKEHIIKSVNNSLQNLQTDYIDVLLIHRPDPFMNPEEVAEAFSKLKKEGKVLNFGVSNFKPSQFNMLSSYLEFPLVTNQIEISVMNLQGFQDGSIDQCLEKRILPMAWSPLSGGKIFNLKDERTNRLQETLQKIGTELGVNSIDVIMYAWLLNHPSKIIPIVGSGKIDRIKAAVEATNINLTTQQWFHILESSTGKEVD